MMTSRRVHTLARRVAGQETPAWITELEALLNHDPSLSMAAAADWFGLNQDTISCWLRAFGRDDLLILLRHSKRPAEWADLAEQAFRSDPTLTLAEFAARHGAVPHTAEQALARAGRTDLLARLGRRRYRRAAEWVELAEQALRADPTLTLAGFAAQHRRALQAARSGLINAGRQDLVDAFRHRTWRYPAEWADLAQQALQADPTITLAQFAARQHRTKQTIRLALIKAGRDDLLAAFRPDSSTSKPVRQRVEGGGVMTRRSRSRRIPMPMPGLAWMRDAACQDEPGLPWIGPPRDDWSLLDDPINDTARMREICDGCPVRAACEAFVQAAGVTAGFWAGRWRRDRRDMPRRGRRRAA